jgi:L-ascorbate metabolism protein UlaG (beta-lactamase superfamily)
MTILIIATAIIILALVLSIIFLQHPQFGKRAEGERRSRIDRSPNFRQGQFQNLLPTPALTEGKSYASVMREYLLHPKALKFPDRSIPAVKTDLHSLDPALDCMIWFGHSSYLLQVHGKKFLVDPVLSRYASPLKNMVRSFQGTDIYSPSDIPPVDYLIITHDHYDHMDHSTLAAISGKVGLVITGLGVGAHLEHWGYDGKVIIELDWYEEAALNGNLKIICTPARHFSGRGFKRNTTLWSSFVLDSDGKKLFIGGDSGYGIHFREIGNKYGPFDLAILENGQYHESWKYIHMMPEEAVEAAIDLRAARLFPVHWSRFSLSLHAWDEPILRLLAQAKIKNMTVLHPMIGAIVPLSQEKISFPAWWESFV